MWLLLVCEGSFWSRNALIVEKTMNKPMPRKSRGISILIMIDEGNSLEITESFGLFGLTRQVVSVPVGIAETISLILLTPMLV